METILAAYQAASQLGISSSQLRRHTVAYEKVHGPLARDIRRHRVYTVSIVEKIEAAHKALTAGRFVSLEAALVAARDGELPATAPGRLDLVADLSQRVAQLEGYLLAERDDLKRRNDYLIGELQRRDALEAPRRRRWWRG